MRDLLGKLNDKPVYIDFDCTGFKILHGNELIGADWMFFKKLDTPITVTAGETLANMIARVNKKTINKKNFILASKKTVLDFKKQREILRPTKRNL